MACIPGLRRNNPHSGIEQGSDKIHNPEDRHRAPPRRLNRQDPPPYEPASLLSFSADGSARPNDERRGGLPRRLCLDLLGSLAGLLLRTLILG